MPAITPAEQTTLRTRRHEVEWYLAVAPYGDPCFTARVNDAGIARGAMSIVYDTDVGEVNVSPGQTLWIGSAAGLSDVGTVRIRSINTITNTLSVAENSEILWVDDLYLTCPGAYGFREPWSVYQRIVCTGAAVTFYHDYDITYNDPQDDVLPPKANAGPPVCAWLNTDDHADVSFTGDRSATTEIGAAIATYAWDFADGVVISGGVAQAGTCAVPNVVRFTTPGFRYVSLTVTDDTAQARTGTVYVPVWVFKEGVQDPFTQVEVVSQAGRVDSGWSCRLKVYQTNTAAEDVIHHFSDKALVVLFTKTEYDDVSTQIGGFCHRESIRFVGWLRKETLKFDSESGVVEFEAVSTDQIMRALPGFSFTLEDDSTPSDWYEVNDLDVDRALHYLLEYHSTINQVTHVELPGESSTRPVAIQVFQDSSLYSQAQEHLLGDAQCKLCCDRQGILRATRDPQFMDVGDRNLVDVVCTVSRPDWMNELDESRSHIPALGMTRLGGFSYETPLLTRAPGAAPLQQENEYRSEGFIFQGQAEANLWSGLTLTKANLDYPRIPLELVGNWPVFDPAFQEYIRLTTTDPLDRHIMVNQRFVIREMSFRDHPDNGTSVTNLVLEKENPILLGETVTIPNPPVPEPPYYPPPPTPEPTPPAWGGTIQACVAWHEDEIGYTPDLLERHSVSITTAGTGLLNLFDNTADFHALGIVIGDVIENLTDSASTHVAAIVSATQLTLVADIGLGVGTGYSTCGTQWTDITPGTFNPLMEHIIQFLYTRTGENTVGGWLLTTHEVFYTPNILTSSPTWSSKLTIAAVNTATGYPWPGSGQIFHGMHAMVANPEYLIVSFNHNNWTSAFGCVYTGNLGGAWAYSTFTDYDGRGTARYGIEIDESTGMIFNVRGTGGINCKVCVSGDGGANFAVGGNNNVAVRIFTQRCDLYRPYGGSALNVTILDSVTSPGVSADNAANWALLVAAGYTPDVYLGINGWVGDASDLICMWERTVDNAQMLLRSSDAGANWVEIGDSAICFPHLPFGSIFRCVAPETWQPNEDELVWTGICIRAAGIETCRIKYTSDNGVHWSGKMGNWYTIGLDWKGLGLYGFCGCIPLPTVGANAH